MIMLSNGNNVTLRKYLLGYCAPYTFESLKMNTFKWQKLMQIIIRAASRTLAF